MPNPALLPVSLAAICVFGCSSNSTTTDASARIDSAAAVDAPVACNPATNEGCAPGEKCAVIIQSRSPNFFTTTDCVPDGSVPVGGACTVDSTVADGGTGISNCVGATECNGGVCNKVCDSNAVLSDCATDELCRGYNGYYDNTAFGFCDSPCDPIGDDGAGGQDTGCVAADGCYPNIFSVSSIFCAGPSCNADNQCTDGAECGCTSCCHPGKGCVTVNSAGDELLCAKLCITPNVARGLTEGLLPLAADAAHNGQAPWDCARVNDGPDQANDPRPYPQFVCIPLAGDDYVRYWSDRTTANGWPYGSVLGVCIDTSINGDPYQFDPVAGAAAGLRRWQPKQDAKGLFDALQER